MPRKGHTKSRKGCYECKKRHLKCDEGRPVCHRCSSSNRLCSYEAFEYAVNVSHPSSTPVSTSSDKANSARPGVEALSPSASITGGLTQDSLVHLRLFYNFEHYTCRTVARTEEHISIYRRTILNRVFEVPYLMQAVLGLSALHLSLEPSNQTTNYKHMAAVFQAQALENFDTNILQNVNEDNVLDILLFQHVIALHVFCDIFSNVEGDFGDFIERLLECINLLRGVESVTQPWWHVLSQSELGAVMQTSDAHQKSPRGSYRECDPLLAMIEKADLSGPSIEVCRSSIERLQSYFDAENDLDGEPIESTNMLFAWLVTASPEYTGLLGRRRPEALVILAYFAVLLFRRRRSWAVANSGQKLLRHIQNYLGRTWEDYLAWPQNEIFGASSTNIEAGREL